MNLSEQLLASANFHLIFNTIAKTSGYFAVVCIRCSQFFRIFSQKPQDPNKMSLNICTIAQVAEMLEQYHNHVAVLMQGTKTDFGEKLRLNSPPNYDIAEFLDQIKEAVNYAKYLRDKVGPDVQMGAVFNLLVSRKSFLS